MSDTDQQSIDAIHYPEGIRLFNIGRYWDAHEQWEDCWRYASEPDATFYKGVIQTAAALVHWQRGNLRGLQRNWLKARPKLATLPSPMRGLNLSQLIADMDAFVDSEGHAVPPMLVQV